MTQVKSGDKVYIKAIVIETDVRNDQDTAFIGFDTSGGVSVYQADLIKRLSKEEVYTKYMEWVEEVSEALEDKSTFTPQELVYKVFDIIKNG